MKTTEELADELNIKFDGSYDSLTDSDYVEFTLTKHNLEALCKAYMQDRLESLEPVAWKYRYTDDGDFQVSLSPTCEDDLSWLKQTYKDFEIHQLHDISTLKDKP